MNELTGVKKQVCNGLVEFVAEHAEVLVASMARGHKVRIWMVPLEKEHILQFHAVANLDELGIQNL